MSDYCLEVVFSCELIVARRYLLLHAEPAWDALKVWWEAADGEVRLGI